MNLFMYVHTAVLCIHYCEQRMAAAEAAQARAEQRATSAVTSAQAEHVTARGASQRLTAALALCSRLHAAARCATATAATATSSNADSSEHANTTVAAVVGAESSDSVSATDSTTAVEELMRLVYNEVPPLLSTQPSAASTTATVTEQYSVLAIKPVSPRPRTPTKSSTSASSSSASGFNSSFSSTLHHPVVQALLFVADSAAHSAWSRHSSNSSTSSNTNTSSTGTTAGDSVEVRVSLQEGPLARAARTGRTLVLTSTKQQQQQQQSSDPAVVYAGADVTADVTGDVACQLPPDCDAAVYLPLRAPVFAAFAQLNSATTYTSSSSSSSSSNSVAGSPKGVLGVLRVLKMKGAGGCTASEVQALQAVGDAAGAALYAVLARKQLEAHNYSEHAGALQHAAGKLTLLLYLQVLSAVICTCRNFMRLGQATVLNKLSNGMVTCAVSKMLDETD
jgi:hypothetical protein